MKISSNSFKNDSDWVWTLDPLDGTKDFIQGTCNYAMHLALNYKFKPILGIVLIPEKEELWIGYGNDAWCEKKDGSKIKPNLSKGKTLLFTHGFAIHFGLIKAPRGVSVIMVAPKGPGHIVRSQYKEGKGVPALIAVNKGSSKDAKKIALAWAAGVGAARSGILETSFKEETETDLFGEQAVLCGGASALVEAGFETLVEAGYAPEMAYFECLHELKLIVDLMIESGIAGMRFSVSETAKYGDVTRGPRVINGNVKKSMKSILKEIQSGKFAKEWVKEYQAGLPKYNKLLEDGEKHPIEETGQRLRSLMPWIPKKNIKGAQASYS